ncbi:thioredoxin domain-containing protein [Thiomicrorhabdus sp.]|uniref:thioredoxin domain-containing protein n=1 Tax=Thiomicrorhabdus sp. TaxID=2039724 RepID=UPI0029C67590|nr:thioredoxin domain-containing protein [Thiomicrorhabdus sp.]
MSLKKIPVKDFDVAVLTSSWHTPVAVFFTAKGCEPCEAVLQTLTELAPQYEDRLHIAVLDIEDQEIEPVLEQCKVESIPDIKIFHQKQIVAQAKGLLDKQQFERLIEPHVLTEAQHRLSLLQKQVELLLSSEQFDMAMELVEVFRQKHPHDDEAMLVELAILVQMNNIPAALQLIEQLPENLQQDEKSQAVKGMIEAMQNTRQ